MNFYDDIEKYGDSIALISEPNDVVSYVDLLTAADKLGGLFGKKSLVLLMGENSPETIIGYLGCLRSRAVPLLIGTGTTAETVDDLLATYKPEYLWLPLERAALRAWGREVHRVGNYVLLHTGNETEATLHEELALLLTTSGTTGSPMLVRLSYQNIDSNAAAIAQYLNIEPTDRPITTLPVHYTFGLSVINSHLLRGCAIVLTNKSLMDRAFWDMLRTHEASTFSGVPYTYEILKKLGFGRLKLASLRSFTQAGGKLDVELSRELATFCEQKGVQFVVMYGQAEATARMSYLPSQYAIAKAGSIGIALPGGTFWLEDENRNVIQDSSVEGELIFQGPNVSLGYATTRLDLSKGDENHGILRTGDLAKRDDDGFFYITGRKKRFLKLFGNRTNLDDVERMLNTMGYSCACTGVDDHMRIYVVGDADRSAIRALLAERTGIHPSAFDVIQIEQIPRSESGKITYSALN